MNSSLILRSNGPLSQRAAAAAVAAWVPSPVATPFTAYVATHGRRPRRRRDA